MSHDFERFLAEGPNKEAPDELDLRSTDFGDAEASKLAACPSLRHIRKLFLNRARLRGAGCEALASSPFLQNVSILELSSNRIGKRGACALAASPFLRKLRILVLHNCGVEDVGLCALVASPNLAQVQVLRLEDNRITDIGIRALASASLPALEEIELQKNHIQDPGALALASSRSLPSLKIAELCSNAITQVGAKALAASPWFPSLRNLYLASRFLLVSEWTILGRRSEAFSKPLKIWEEESDPAWRLLAYSLLPPDLQALYRPAFLEIVLALSRNPSDAGGRWGREHLLSWTGAALEAAAARFPDFTALQERLQGDRRRLAALEDPLFSA